MYYNALDFMLDTVNDFEWLLEDGGRLFVEDYTGDLVSIQLDDYDGTLFIDTLDADKGFPAVFTSQPGVGNFIRIVGGLF